MWMWMFPGQGAQAVGMGRDLYEQSSAARAVFDEADDALGMALSRIVFDGPMDALTRTEHAQPALLTMSIATLRALEERAFGLPLPVCAAGHSLGEYSALVAAGVLPLRDALRVVRARGRAMQVAVPLGMGGMAAIVGLSADEVRTLCDQARGSDVLSAANYNSPAQTVVAGHAAAVSRVSDLCEEHGGRAIELPVSAPFHCALMAPVRDTLEKELEGVKLGAFRFPVVANVDAEPIADEAGVRERLISQVDSPVRWEECVRRAVAMGASRALEIGPGTTLSALCKRIDKRLVAKSAGSMSAIDDFAEGLDRDAS